MPAVEVLDMRGADPRSGPFHSGTLEALDRVRAAGSKAIVLLNRRGFAPYLCCRSCGRDWGCPHCDVSLVLHRNSRRLACHHCGHSESLPEHCPECGSVTLAQAGAGTERVEALLAERLAPAPVFRLDSDSAGGRGHGEILERFEAAAGGVLVGTQMVGKGHDFPQVTLSVVIDADATLRFPDFRAEERTFAMVAQLAGRSGRSEAGGSVIVQTLAPDAPSIVSAAQHDAAGFLAGEIERRRALRYPPFSHLVRIGIAGEQETKVETAAAVLAARLRDSLPPRTELLGPAPLFRLRDRYRRRLLLKSQDRSQAVAAVRDAVEGMATARRLRDVAIGVDVDPQ
jgi:primosomal protein N' (replication factor Y)